MNARIIGIRSIDSLRSKYQSFLEYRAGRATSQKVTVTGLTDEEKSCGNADDDAAMEGWIADLSPAESWRCPNCFQQDGRSGPNAA